MARISEETEALVGRLEETVTALICWIYQSANSPINQQECHDLLEMLIPTKTKGAISAKVLIAQGRHPRAKAAVNRDGSGRA